MSACRYVDLRQLRAQLRDRNRDPRFPEILAILAPDTQWSSWVPIGGLVDFLLSDSDDLHLAIEPEARDRIAIAAYEAAREVIVAGIHEHLHATRQVWRVLSHPTKRSRR